MPRISPHPSLLCGVRQISTLKLCDEPPSHKRTDFRGGGFTVSLSHFDLNTLALVLRSPSTARPLRCAYAPALCLAKASVRLPGWGQGLRPCTRFFGSLREFSLARERGTGRARRFSPSRSRPRPPPSFSARQVPHAPFLFELALCLVSTSTSRRAFLRCAGKV